jgi:hypothetical protein
MGFAVREPDAAKAQEDEAPELDWYPFYCQAIAAGVAPERFGDYTYSQIVAMVDAAKLTRYNDMYFNVSDVVSNMDDDGVRKAIHGGDGGNPMRKKLLERMMTPYTPSFMLPEVAAVRSAAPIPGMTPKTAEGIMRAIEQKLIPHEQWLTIHKVWQRIHATARGYR